MGEGSGLPIPMEGIMVRHSGSCFVVCLDHPLPSYIHFHTDGKVYTETAGDPATSMWVCIGTWREFRPCEGTWLQYAQVYPKTKEDADYIAGLLEAQYDTQSH